MMLTVVSLLVALSDQAIKWLVVHRLPLDVPQALWPGYVYLTYSMNPGTAFGFMSGLPTWVRIPFFVLVTVVAGFIVYAYQRSLDPRHRGARIALSLIWGGALGNFMDRMVRGQVVDFVDLRYHQFQWYVFNLADSCITVGLTILIVQFLLSSRQKRETREAP